MSVLKLHIVIILLALCVPVFGAEKWTGNVDSDWENPLNWDGGTVPTDGQNVLIDSVNEYTGARAHPIIGVTSSFIAGRVDVKGGGKLFIEASFTADDRVTVDNKNATGYTSEINMSGGTFLVDGDQNLQVKKGAVFNLNGGTLLVSKDLNIDGGTFNMDESVANSALTVNSNGSGKGTLKLKPNGASNASFNQSGGRTVITGGAAIGLQLDGKGTGGVTSATLNVSGGAFTNASTTEFKKDITDSTPINITGGIVNLMDQVASDPGSGKMDINLSAGELELEGPLIMELQDQLLMSGTGILRYRGTNSWTNEGSVIASGGTTIIEGNITLNDATGSWQLNHLEIAAGGTLNQLDPPNISISGNYLNSGGLFTAATNQVTFNANGLQTITTADVDIFNDLTITATSLTNVLEGSSITIVSTLDNSGELDNDGTVNFVNGYENQPGTLSGNGTHNLSGGNWILTGTFNPDSSNVVFGGTLAQTLQGATDFFDLTMNNPLGASIVSGQQGILNSLVPNVGTFTTNNLLALRSNATSTGSIGEIKAASDIIGNVEVQRYIAPAPTSWRFFSTATSGQTLADWNDDIITSGFPGSDYPTFPFISIYRYDETQIGDKDDWFNYIAASSITDPILTNEGYWVYVGPAPITFETNGPINKYNQSLNVSWSDGGSLIDDGWCLIPNPYPSAIDWDAASGWTKTGVNDAIYVWNPDNQQYSSYIAGVGTNGGSRYVPSQQAFYVQTNAPGPTLQLTEEVKAPNQKPEFKTNTTPSILRLNVSDGANWDEMVIRFDDNATTSFDPMYDALKLPSFETGAPIFASYADSNIYSIQSLDFPSADISIPLFLEVGTAGTYQITASEIAQLPLSSCLILEDIELGTYTDLRLDSYYNFYISDTISSQRFYLHIGSPLNKDSKPTSCYSFTDGSATIVGKGTGPWNYEWRDMNDSILSISIGSSLPDTLNGLAEGVYQVNVKGPGMCLSLSDTIDVLQPTELVSTIEVTDISCFGFNDGEVNVSVNGGTPGYEYYWSTGQVTTTGLQSNLEPGPQWITTIDNNGCVKADTFLVDEPLPITLNYVVVVDSSNCLGSIELTASGGTPGFIYQWDHGIATPTLDELCAGDYIVEISDANGCSRLDTINVGYKHIPTYEEPEPGQLLLYPNPSSSQLTVAIQLNSQAASLEILDITGKLLLDKQLPEANGLLRMEFDVSSLPSGTYIARVILNDHLLFEPFVVK